MKSLVVAVRPAYRIAKVLAKGSFKRGSLFDVKRLESKGKANRYTIVVSKKSGGDAVERNRIKRRLKEALRLVLRENQLKHSGEKPNSFDYIFIARSVAIKADFQTLIAQMRTML